jgi:hypothetical protein
MGPLSVDLRKRVVAAVREEGMSCRAAARRWFDGQLDLDPLKLVFVDETAATTNMARRYGRRRRGQSLRPRHERADVRGLA